MAGLKVQGYAETTPSITGVDVIGVLTDGYALNAAFDSGSEPR